MRWVRAVIIVGLSLLLTAGALLGASLRFLPQAMERLLADRFGGEIKIAKAYWKAPLRLIAEGVEIKGWGTERLPDTGFYADRVVFDLGFRKRAKGWKIGANKLWIHNPESAIQKNGDTITLPELLKSGPTVGGFWARAADVVDFEVGQVRVIDGRLRILDVGIQEKGFASVVDDMFIDFVREDSGDCDFFAKGRIFQGREAGEFAVFKLEIQKRAQQAAIVSASIDSVWIPYWQPYIHGFFDAELWEGVLAAEVSGRYQRNEIQSRLTVSMKRLMGRIGAEVLPSDLGATVLTTAEPAAYRLRLTQDLKEALIRERGHLRPPKLVSAQPASLEELAGSSESPAPSSMSQDWRRLRAASGDSGKITASNN